MKKSIICGSVITVLGLLIVFGPQFIFKVCGTGCGCCGDIPTCHWSAQAEIGMGMLIAALGLCFIVFNDSKTQLGLIIGVFLSGIIALAIPHALIGGCEMKNMACHRVAFPAITVIGAVLLAGSAAYAILSEVKKDNEFGAHCVPNLKIFKLQLRTLRVILTEFKKESLDKSLKNGDIIYVWILMRYWII